MPGSVSRTNKRRLRELVKMLNRKRHIAAIVLGVGQDDVMGQLSVMAIPDMDRDTVRIVLTRALQSLDTDLEVIQEEGDVSNS